MTYKLLFRSPYTNGVSDKNVAYIRGLEAYYASREFGDTLAIRNTFRRYTCTQNKKGETVEDYANCCSVTVQLLGNCQISGNCTNTIYWVTLQLKGNCKIHFLE